MPFVIRDDGEHFVIPSYREVLSAKSKSVIKKDVIALSQSYGELITMHRKGPQDYEVTFSPDGGYLLGETVWSYFESPVDMIYCEAIANSNDAILVIVKNGSVYLDGTFPIDSIPEELVVFLTQQNNFEIFLYGDIPISEQPEDGKFSFDPGSVKSFKKLENPVFNTLPLMPAYHLQPVDVTLKANGIGTIHILPFVVLGGLIVIAYVGYIVVQALQTPPERPMEINPYQTYVDNMASPAPDKTVVAYIYALKTLLNLPGWTLKDFNYSGGNVEAKVVSGGASIKTLLKWCEQKRLNLIIKPNGIFITSSLEVPARAKPKVIYPIKQVLITFLDKLERIYPGNHIRMTTSKSNGPYTNYTITIDLAKTSPATISSIGALFKGMPFTLDKIVLSNKEQELIGSLTLTAYGI